ncbi:hypothetical protein [Aeromicrobium endophyticum]|uniref:Uncharacterized protein n=1 Tax=Aeromicrobium endophyticum TaxID=2292704 RepID=A0A371PBT2_9ACTN|nr:hypothetical protein [Aeromicrobium endophyticum]REK73036.1 hypothetical protein DX116_05465 [Aeromicrobium endophyticum]
MPTGAGDDADGLLVVVSIRNDFDTNTRTCATAAFVATDASFDLTGSAVVSGAAYDRVTQQYNPVAPLRTQSLSGAVTVVSGLDALGVDELSVSASGDATKTTTTVKDTRVTDKKTKAQKTKAKATYVKRIKAAKKKYATALDEAGISKTKQAAAKKTYKAKRATAKASFKHAIAGHEHVKTKTSTTENRPFSIKTELPAT